MCDGGGGGCGCVCCRGRKLSLLVVVLLTADEDMTIEVPETRVPERGFHDDKTGEEDEDVVVVAVTPRVLEAWGGG